MLQKLIENFREKCRAENKNGKVVVYVGSGLYPPGAPHGRKTKPGELSICFEPSWERHKYLLKQRRGSPNYRKWLTGWTLRMIDAGNRQMLFGFTGDPKQAEAAEEKRKLQAEEKQMKKLEKPHKKSNNIIAVHGSFGTPHLNSNSSENTQRTARKVQSGNLEQGSVDELHVHNVLTVKDLTENDRLGILMEAARVLSPEGAAYFGHTLTPKTCSSAELKRLVDIAGLKIEVLAGEMGNPDEGGRKFTKKEKKIICEVMGSHAITKFHQAEGAFLARLTKKGNRE